MKINSSITAIAVQFEMERWATMTNNNISRVSLPEIPTDDPLIKSALWFNFGMDAGKNLSLAFSLMAKRAALPVWIAFKAQELYANNYKTKMKNAHVMLSQPFTRFRSELMDAVANSARMYTGTTSGGYSEVKTTLLKLFNDHDFVDEGQAMAAIRELVSDSEVINTKNTDNLQIIQQNLRALGKKIIDIYRGTKESSLGGTHLLYASNRPNAKIPSKAYITSASCSRPEPRQTPADYQKINTADKSKMAELYANAHLTDVNHIDYIRFMPCFDTSYVRTRSTTEAPVSAIIRNSYRGAIANLEKTYKKLYPQGAKTMRQYRS